MHSYILRPVVASGTWGTSQTYVHYSVCVMLKHAKICICDENLTHWHYDLFMFMLVNGILHPDQDQKLAEKHMF